MSEAFSAALTDNTSTWCAERKAQPNHNGERLTAAIWPRKRHIVVGAVESHGFCSGGRCASSRPRTGIKLTMSHTTQSSVREPLERGKRGEKKRLKVERFTPQRLTKVMRERKLTAFGKTPEELKKGSWNRELGGSCFPACAWSRHSTGTGCHVTWPANRQFAGKIAMEQNQLTRSHPPRLNKSHQDPPSN